MFLSQGFYWAQKMNLVLSLKLILLKHDTIIDRIDYRPSKRIVKVLFKSHFTELQINVQTGDIVSVNRRFDAIIEKLHDGSIFDFYFTNSNISKIVYTLSLGIIFMTVSGFLLWYYPKI